jgi:hypothetical protein
MTQSGAMVAHLTERSLVPEPIPPHAAALVWIDGKVARILRWRGRVLTETIGSGVPPHVRGTDHIRHDPLVRHGGSGRGQDDAERWRNEHLRAYLKRVAGRLADERYVEILGTGTVCDRLARLLRARAAGRDPQPTIVVVHSNWMTQRALATRFRDRLGLRPRRRTVGAYRWSGDLPRSPSGAIQGPRRVLEKPVRPALD